VRRIPRTRAHLGHGLMQPSARDLHLLYLRIQVRRQMLRTQRPGPLNAAGCVSPPRNGSTSRDCSVFTCTDLRAGRASPRTAAPAPLHSHRGPLLASTGGGTGRSRLVGKVSASRAWRYVVAVRVMVERHHWSMRAGRLGDCDSPGHTWRTDCDGEHFMSICALRATVPRL